MSVNLFDKKYKSLKPIAGIPTYTSIDDTLSETSENPVQNKVVNEAIDKINSELTETKKSVSDGKALVATAITGKGVATEGTATFEVMADNISKIETGGGELHGACISGSTAESFYIGQSIDLVFNDEIIHTATIDSDGTFSFLDIQQPGIYSVSITANDISTVNNITITSDHVINKTILNTVIIANYANVNVSTEEISLFNQTARLYLNDELINEFLISDNGTLNFKISKVGNYTLKSVGDEEAFNTFTITEEDLINKNTILIDLNFSKFVTWANGTDEEIAAMLEAHYAGDINISDYWSIGDTRRVDLMAMERMDGSESHEAQTVEYVIIGIEHDDLKTSFNGHTKAAITIHMKNCLNTKGDMNDDSDQIEYSKYSSSRRRKWINNVFEKSLPLWLQNTIKPVSKETSENKTLKYSTERCFMLSTSEIFGFKFDVQDGVQYEYYKVSSNRIKQVKDNNAFWYGRSGRWYSSGGFQWAEYTCCNRSGSSYTYAAHNTEGLAIAFCL